MTELEKRALEQAQTLIKEGKVDAADVILQLLKEKEKEIVYVPYERNRDPWIPTPIWPPYPAGPYPVICS